MNCGYKKAPNERGKSKLRVDTYSLASVTGYIAHPVIYLPIIVLSGQVTLRELLTADTQ
jgi:hypothetical protein